MIVALIDTIVGDERNVLKSWGEMNVKSSVVINVVDPNGTF